MLSSIFDFDRGQPKNQKLWTIEITEKKTQKLIGQVFLFFSHIFHNSYARSNDIDAHLGDGTFKGVEPVAELKVWAYPEPD